MMRLYISSTEMVMHDGYSYSYNVAQHGYAGGGMIGNGMTTNNDGGNKHYIRAPIDNF